MNQRLPWHCPGLFLSQGILACACGDCMCSRFACVPYSFSWRWTTMAIVARFLRQHWWYLVLIVITVSNISSVMEKSLSSSGNKSRPASKPSSTTRMGKPAYIHLLWTNSAWTRPSVSFWHWKYFDWKSSQDFRCHRARKEEEFYGFAQPAASRITSTENCMDTQRYPWVIDAGRRERVKELELWLVMMLMLGMDETWASWSPFDFFFFVGGYFLTMETYTLL